MTRASKHFTDIWKVFWNVAISIPIFLGDFQVLHNSSSNRNTPRLDDHIFYFKKFREIVLSNTVISPEETASVDVKTRHWENTVQQNEKWPWRSGVCDMIPLEGVLKRLPRHAAIITSRLAADAVPKHDRGNGRPNAHADARARSPWGALEHNAAWRRGSYF